MTVHAALECQRKAADEVMRVIGESEEKFTTSDLINKTIEESAEDLSFEFVRRALLTLIEKGQLELTSDRRIRRVQGPQAR